MISILLTLPYFQKLLIKARTLDKFSFFYGITIGAVFAFGLCAFIVPTSASQMEGKTRGYVRIYDAVTNQLTFAEAMHFKLKANTDYKFKIENIDAIDELDQPENLFWLVEPREFGTIIASGMTANYKTPNISDGSSGFIRVCTPDENSQCIDVLPATQVVIYTK